MKGVNSAALLTHIQKSGDRYKAVSLLFQALNDGRKRAANLPIGLEQDER